MKFKKQENRAIQQLILGGLALICAGLLYLATIKQVTEAQLPAPKAQVKVKKTTTTTTQTTTTSETTVVTEAETVQTETAYEAPVNYTPVVEPVYTEALPVETVIVEAPVEAPVEEPIVETDGSGG